jgi:hypothetical protein
MASWLKNEPIASKRRVALWIWQSDGITPAPAATNFNAIAAFKNLNGIATGSLANVILTWHLVGAAGNSKTIQTIADGTGVGSLTGGPTAYVFHFQTGVTTVNNMITAMSGLFVVSGTFTGTNTLAAGDVFAAQTLGGGQDMCVKLRAGSTTEALGAGTITNVTDPNSAGVPGYFMYEATQAELNFDGSECGIRVTKSGFNDATVIVDMRYGSLDNIVEGSYAGTDLLRLLVRACIAKVNDFRTGTQTVRDLADTKNSITITTDASGRIGLTINDAT